MEKQIQFIEVGQGRCWNINQITEYKVIEDRVEVTIKHGDGWTSTHLYDELAKRAIKALKDRTA
jgi:hypothetical protein